MKKIIPTLTIMLFACIMSVSAQSFTKLKNRADSIAQGYIEDIPAMQRILIDSLNTLLLNKDNLLAVQASEDKSYEKNVFWAVVTVNVILSLFLLAIFSITGKYLRKKESFHKELIDILKTRIEKDVPKLPVPENIHTPIEEAVVSALSTPLGHEKYMPKEEIAASSN